MSASRKIRKPANDQPRPSSQKMAYVALPRVYWSARRLAAAGVLAVFAAIFAVALISNFSAAPVPSPVVQNQPAKKVEPYDITLNASDLAAPEDAPTAAIEKALPLSAFGKSSGHALPPVLDITVESSAEQPKITVPAEQADALAAVAQNYLRQNDLKQAVNFQRRAAEAAPANMLLRLTLAILYDREGDQHNAASLYRQVVEAHDREDGSLPSTLDIDAIRNRLVYLEAKAQK